MKTQRPSIQSKILFYSQLDQKQPNNNSFGSSPQSKSKGKPKREDMLSQNIVQFSLKDIKAKAKNTTIQYVRKVLKIQSFSVQLFNKIQSITNAEHLNEIFELIFAVITESVHESTKKLQLRFPQHSQRQDKEKQLTFAIRSKQAKLLRIIKQDQLTSERVSKGKTAKKLQQCQRVNQNLKKQIFIMKQEKQMLEKRVANLVEQFQNRKTFYLAEIKKLTQIIKMSSFDVRNLVLEKTKEAKQLQNIKQEKNKADRVMTQNLQSQLEINQQPAGRNLNSPKATQRNAYRENVASFNGYNTEIRILKHVSSIQNYQQEKTDSFMP